MATAKMQTQGYKTAVHKQEGYVTDATTIIYGSKSFLLAIFFKL